MSPLQNGDMITAMPKQSRLIVALIAAAKAQDRTLYSLARETGIPYSTLMDWWKGKEPDALTKLETLAKELNLRVDVVPEP